MISDITLGQFFPGFSTVHKLDPRTKILLVVVYIVALFQARGWVGYGLVTLVTLLCTALSKDTLLSQRFVFSYCMHYMLITGICQPMTQKSRTFPVRTARQSASVLTSFSSQPAPKLLKPRKIQIKRRNCQSAHPKDSGHGPAQNAG